MARTAAPSQLKVLQGTFRGDRDGHGPKVEIGLPPCPKWLPADAKRYWAEIGPDLVKHGMIAVIDGGEFARLCECEAAYQGVIERIQSLEGWVDKTPQGYAVVSVWWTLRNKLIEQLDKLNSKFGRSPAARSSLKNISAQGSLDLGGFDKF